MIPLTFVNPSGINLYAGRVVLIFDDLLELHSDWINQKRMHQHPRHDLLISILRLGFQRCAIVNQFKPSKVVISNGTKWQLEYCCKWNNCAAAGASTLCRTVECYLTTWTDYTAHVSGSIVAQSTASLSSVATFPFHCCHRPIVQTYSFDPTRSSPVQSGPVRSSPVQSSPVLINSIPPLYIILHFHFHFLLLFHQTLWNGSEMAAQWPLPNQSAEKLSKILPKGRFPEVSIHQLQSFSLDNQ